MVEDLAAGNGPEAKRGKMVGMYYEGRLKSNNKKFDGQLSGKPFKFRLGHGEVIKGWDLGVEGMKVGSKRWKGCLLKGWQRIQGYPVMPYSLSALEHHIHSSANDRHKIVGRFCWSSPRSAGPMAGNEREPTGNGNQ